MLVPEQADEPKLRFSEKPEGVKHSTPIKIQWEWSTCSSQVSLRIPASVLGLNQGDEDKSFHLVAVFSKGKGESITAKMCIARPFCTSPQPQKTFALPQSCLCDFTPYARVIAQPEWINGHSHKVVMLWKVQIPFSFHLQTFILYLAAQKWVFSHNEPFYICV